MGRNYAHRGLHKIDKSIPENSLPAFEAAARIGYGVELDVHLTRDDELVVFHDDDLKRVCGVEGQGGGQRPSPSCGSTGSAARSTASRRWPRCSPPLTGAVP